MKLKIKKSPFLLNSLTVMIGSTSAQIIAFISLIISTRLYTPSEFGFYSSYAAIVTIIAPILCLSYENIIITVKSDEKSYQLRLISHFISISITFLLLIIFYLIKNYLIKILNNTIIELIPLSLCGALLSNTSLILNSNAYRYKKFKVIGMSKFYDALTHHFFFIVLGFIGIGTYGMLISSFFGYITCIITLRMNLKNEYKFSFENFKHSYELIKRFSNMPKFTTPGVLLNNLSKYLVILIISGFFGFEIAGVIAISFRILQTPTIIINPITNIFLKRISEINSDKVLYMFYKKYCTLGFMFCIFITAIVLLFPNSIINFIVGNQWEDMIKFIKIASFWYFLEMINYPLNTIYLKLEKQKIFLLLNFVNIVVTFTTIYISVLNAQNIYKTLLNLMFVKSIIYITSILLPFSLFKK